MFAYQVVKRNGENLGVYVTFSDFWETNLRPFRFVSFRLTQRVMRLFLYIARACA